MSPSPIIDNLRLVPSILDTGCPQQDADDGLAGTDAIGAVALYFTSSPVKLSSSPSGTTVVDTQMSLAPVFLRRSIGGSEQDQGGFLLSSAEADHP